MAVEIYHIMIGYEVVFWKTTRLKTTSHALQSFCQKHKSMKFRYFIHWNNKGHFQSTYKLILLLLQRWKNQSSKHGLTFWLNTVVRCRKFGMPCFPDYKKKLWRASDVRLNIFIENIPMQTNLLLNVYRWVTCKNIVMLTNKPTSLWLYNKYSRKQTWHKIIMAK